MSKGAKRILIVIIVAILVLAIIWVVYEANKPEPASINAATELPDENKGIDNIINDFVENEVVNETEEVSSVEDAQVDEGEPEPSTESSNSDNTSSELIPGTNESREEKAVELAKEYYEEEHGSSEGIYFRCDSVYKDGRYLVIAGKDARTVAFLYVDVRTELVEEKQ